LVPDPPLVGLRPNDSSDGFPLSLLLPLTLSGASEVLLPGIVRFGFDEEEEAWVEPSELNTGLPTSRPDFDLPLVRVNDFSRGEELDKSPVPAPLLLLRLPSPLLLGRPLPLLKAELEEKPAVDALLGESEGPLLLPANGL